jgi:hypothetical protein
MCFAGSTPFTSTQQVLTGAYRGQDNQACDQCAEEHCHEARGWSCEWSGSPRDCFELLACQLESGCPLGPNGVFDCYCGSTINGGTCLYGNGADGICKREESSTYTMPPTILANYFNIGSGPGAANEFARCSAASCPTCFKGAEGRACPSISAFAIEPNTAGLGTSIELKAFASGAVAGPDLSYHWVAATDGVGVIRDADAPNTQFTCLSAGKTPLILTVSDGNSACDWKGFEVVRCAEQPCGSSAVPSASSRAAFVGESIALHVDALDPQGQPGAFLYAWAADPGELGSLSRTDAETVEYHCASEGLVTITVHVSRPDGGCDRQYSIGLDCVDPSLLGTPDSTRSALTGAYLGRDNQACLSCAEANHCVETDAVLPCEYRANAAERALCLRLLQCELETGCPKSYWGCYCSHSDGCFTEAGAHGGVCSEQVHAALQSQEANFIGNHYWDPELPGGQATILGQCLADHGCDSCFAAE